MMSIRLFFLSLAFVMASHAAVAAQHEGHQGEAATIDAAQAAQCRQAQAMVNSLVDTALKRVEEARLTNNAGAMRDAVDDLQSTLLDIKRQLAPCGQLTASVQPAVSAPAAAAVTQTAPAAAAVDAHAAHTASPPPQPANSRATAPVRAVRPAVPAAHETDEGHSAPAAVGAAATSRPAAAARRAAPSLDHAGHAMPVRPSAASATPRSDLVSPPPTELAELKCGTQVDPKTAPRMLHQGRMYYFCSEQERGAFAKDPSNYALPAGEAAPAHAH